MGLLLELISIVSLNYDYSECLKQNKTQTKECRSSQSRFSPVKT